MIFPVRILAALLFCAGEASDEEFSASDRGYGAMLDLAYALDFNFPENHQWRSKSTTRRVNELAPNPAMGYVRKDATVQSRSGMELGIQGG